MNTAKSNLARRSFLQCFGLLGIALTTVPIAGRQVFAQSNMPNSIEALVFDVFGTVVDWRGSIIREGQLLAAKKGYSIDWAQFADRWRAGYGPAMNRVRSGELPWTKIDDLHRMILDELVQEFSLEGMTEQELDHFNRAWHRLSPWPDSVPGLNRLKNRFIIATLSNGNLSLLTRMAKNAGLPWDAVLSAELSRHYKPDLKVYLKAVDLLSLQPRQVMMVACHPRDLQAAAQAGLRTAYVIRLLEKGPGQPVNRNPNGNFDYMAEDFLDLAKQLGV